MATLQVIGVSGAALWTALAGFVAVAAVAFFAAWSVLSNIFCALLILTTRPFRLGDKVELQAKSGKPLARYFPEVAAALFSVKQDALVVDGEILSERADEGVVRIEDDSIVGDFRDGTA